MGTHMEDYLTAFVAWKVGANNTIIALDDHFTYGKVRLLVGVTYAGYCRGYWYEDLTSAVRAFEQFDGLGDPDGWFRCVTDGRRRPNGDAAREYIHF